MTNVNSKTPETIEELMRWSSTFLQSKAFPSPRLDTELLLCHVLQCRRIDLYMRFDQPLSRLELASFKALIIRRLHHEPVAYIVGYKEFMNLRFQVNTKVLIPRPETELLVEQAIEFAKTKNKPLRILEVGMGSGCIGISLLHALNEATLVGWDISPEAIEVAKANAKGCGVDSSRLDIQIKDALNEKSWMGIERFDIIISNPPYIGEKERGQLETSVVAFEPELALFAGDEGLAFYRAIGNFARECLAVEGKVFLEIGASQGGAVREILKSFGWKDLVVKKDYSRHDRIIEGSYE